MSDELHSDSEDTTSSSSSSSSEESEEEQVIFIPNMFQITQNRRTDCGQMTNMYDAKVSLCHNVNEVLFTV